MLGAAVLLLCALAATAASAGNNYGYGVWTASEMTAHRSYHMATRLQDGRVLVAGGWNDDHTAFRETTELYDPATGEWDAGEDMLADRSHGQLITLLDGRVLAVGGIRFNTGALPAEIFDPSLAAGRRLAVRFSRRIRTHSPRSCPTAGCSPLTQRRPPCSTRPPAGLPPARLPASASRPA
jgi:hypothetical protein